MLKKSIHIGKISYGWNKTIYEMDLRYPNCIQMFNVEKIDCNKETKRKKLLIKCITCYNT